MKIFISWSGARSKAVASIIKDYLPRVIQALRPWMSTTDIEAGQRWGIEIGDKLQECDIGICVVTSDNLDHPWLHFEAGAISKSVKKGRVIPFLFDVRPSDLSGPLSQFQAKEASKTGCLEVFETLNGLIEDAAVAHLEDTFDLHWPGFETALDDVRKNKELTSTRTASTRSDREVLDEILEKVRALNTRPGVAPGTESLLDSPDAIKFPGLNDFVTASIEIPKIAQSQKEGSPVKQHRKSEKKKRSKS